MSDKPGDMGQRQLIEIPAGPYLFRVFEILDEGDDRGDYILMIAMMGGYSTFAIEISSDDMYSFFEGLVEFAESEYGGNPFRLDDNEVL